ncbi:MAG: GNAT family N-acetyltransferase [Actinomycetota bacterium]|nr:GNAT family N-acetyltransferase [Actinomycetota bacterium]
MSTGDTYAYSPRTPESNPPAMWMQPNSDRRFAYIAEHDGSIVGTAYLKPDAVGFGDHICNSGWMIAPDSTGEGIGLRFAKHVIDQAREFGFLGMQFNAAVASDARAVRLWESMSFDIVGTVPDAFRHATDGLTATHVMYRRL